MNDLYFVRPTSQAAREKLVDYLEENGYTYIHSADRESTLRSKFPLTIDVRAKTLDHIGTITSAAASVKLHISEEEFYLLIER